MAGLDGLRGVAILLVLVHHARFVYATSLDNTFMPGGFLGVDLFFVLSGFLITGLLLHEFRARKSVRLGAFYRRRFLRLYPALLALLIVHAFYAAYSSIPRPIETDTLRAVMLYYFNWRQSLLTPQSLGHLWSLSVEEQFYLVWPLALIGLLLLTHARRRYLLPIVFGAVVVIAVYRAWRWHDGMFPLWIYERTDTRADSLLVGALLALVFGGLEPHARSFARSRWISSAAWIATAVFAACVLRARSDKPFLYEGGFTLVAFASAVLIVAVLPSSSWIGARALRTQPLCALGVISYGLYLWHLPVFIATQQYGQSIPPVARVGLALAITALCTSLSWFFVEQPFLRWKDRLEGRTRGMPASASATAA